MTKYICKGSNDKLTILEALAIIHSAAYDHYLDGTPLCNFDFDVWGVRVRYFG